MVQTVKDKLRKIDGPWEIKIPNMLLGLRVTPCSTTNKCPSELLMNRRLRTVINALHPDNIQYRKGETQILNKAQQTHRETYVGQDIMFRNYASGPRWLPGQVIEKEGPSNYRVQAGDGAVLRRHIDQIIKIDKGEKEKQTNGGNCEVQEQVTVASPDDAIEQNEHDDDLENDPIIEIPSSEKWEEMLGIPKTAENDIPGGKIRVKRHLHSKAPYSRPTSELN